MDFPRPEVTSGNLVFKYFQDFCVEAKLSKDNIFEFTSEQRKDFTKYARKRFKNQITDFMGKNPSRETISFSKILIGETDGKRYVEVLKNYKIVGKLLYFMKDYYLGRKKECWKADIDLLETLGFGKEKKEHGYYGWDHYPLEFWKYYIDHMLDSEKRLYNLKTNPRKAKDLSFFTDSDDLEHFAKEQLKKDLKLLEGDPPCLKP